MRVIIDKSKCESHQRCSNLYPDLFALDDDGKARVIVTDAIPEELEVDAQSAANSCPAGAITIEY